MDSGNSADLRLTAFAHGGGCGCKLAPSVLEKILRDMPKESAFPNLLVGIENSDDAAVYQLNPDQAVVATTDFFTPIVDDPGDFGRIAATNAISDLYAMGARPIFALAIVGMPVGKLPPEVMGEIMKGAHEICAKAGIPIAGGHSIDTPEPIFGLAATGLVHPDRVKTNAAGRAGDALILGKPLGIGILSAALKKGKLSADAYRVMLDWTTRLNTPGLVLAQTRGVHAMTDVTGFGLLGHLLEICRGSKTGASLSWKQLPLLPEALHLAREGHATGASTRNWESYGADVGLPAAAELWQRHLLCDPQTSGGLLVSCEPGVVQNVIGAFQREGFTEACVIGHLTEGQQRVTVNFSD